MLKIGVLGAGHLGKIHIKLLKDIDEFELVGFFDPNNENSINVEKEYNIQRYESVEALIDDVDAIDIVTPTLSHFDCAVSALKKYKHIFVEKPLTNTVEESNKLVELVKEAGIKLQVGHVERFNPAFIAAKEIIDKPLFIETHRLAQFNPRGTDVSVVLDLMIHDIDIILSTLKSNVKKISASGVAVVSDSPDIANARIEFDNGCVANITASRISLKNMRKSRFFQKNAYITVDFLEKTSEIIKIKDVDGDLDPLAMTMDLGGGKGKKQIMFESPDCKPINSIKEELISFAKSINNNTTPVVSLLDGHNALCVAHQIIDKMQMTTNN